MPIVAHPSKSRTFQHLETCPGCGWAFDSQPCCDLPQHNIGTACPRCGQRFISAAAPPLPPLVGP